MAEQEAVKNKGVVLDSVLVTKAVHALLKHHESKTSNELLGNESSIHVLVGLVVPPKEASSKHHTIVLPHAVYKDFNNDAEICLIVKNEETKKDIQELQTRFADWMKPVRKILTLDSLRSKHGDYAQRRALMKRYTLFLVDDRIAPMMPKALGRDFIRKHKLPLPIKINGGTTHLANALERSVRSTYYTVSAGSCVSIKVAVTTMSPTSIVDNILTASRLLHFHTKAVQNICIKSPESVALPIYNQTPEQLYDIIALAREAEQESGQVTVETKDPVPSELSSKSASKSPLLKALKKQKELEKKEVKQVSKESGSAIVNDTTIVTKEEGKDVKVEMEAEEHDEEAKISKKNKRRNKNTETPEAKKSKDTGSNSEALAVKEEIQNEPNKKKDDTETTNQESKSLEKLKDDRKLATSNGGSGKKRIKDEDSSLPSKKKKIDDNVDADSTKKKKIDDDVDADFLPAEKYTDSKKGYVFKKGPNGLGYYVDTKPVVSKTAMDALRRSSKSSHGSSKSQFKSKTSSKRRR